MIDLDTIRANRRILIIDDLAAIHEDIGKILCPARLTDEAILRIKAAPFLSQSALAQLPRPPSVFDLTFAFQGEEGLDKARAAAAGGAPYAMAFVDGRMPPGWTGIETIRKLWAACPDLQIVMCTAYADHTWEEITHMLDANDNLVILKKPFDVVEVQQLAESMTRRWQRNQEVSLRLEELDHLLETGALELEQSNRKLSATLQQADVANAATHALNHVSRILGHLGGGSHELATHLKNSHIASVARLAHILGENRVHLGAFGEKLPTFLAHLAALLDQERHRALQEIVRLNAELERMRAAVGLPPASPSPRTDSGPPAAASGEEREARARQSDPQAILAPR